MSFFPVQAAIKIVVSVKCSQCGDYVERDKELSPAALTTGNTTESAAFWYDQMVAQVLTVCRGEQWTMVEMAEGPPAPQCGVCTAKDKRLHRGDTIFHTPR